MSKRVPALKPIKLLKKAEKPPIKPPTTKLKLSNKLSVSPLNQELRGLGPVSPSRQVFMKEPVFTKYSHREIVLPAKRVSPSTREDPDKPSLLNKQKAQKLVLLQKAINQLE